MDRQVDLLDLLVNRALYTGKYCIHTHLQHPVRAMSGERLVMLLNDAYGV